MRFYVYSHVDPRTGEIVYIGKGSGGRAWDVTRDRGKNIDHKNWMLELSDLGYIPSDWVMVEKSGLSDKDARTLELEFIHSHGGSLRFNRQGGDKNHMAKMTNEQVINAFKLRDAGWKHREIAEYCGVSRPTISMALSGRQWKAITSGVRIDRE